MSGMVRVPNNGDHVAHLALFLRAEVESLDYSVHVYREILAKQERKLADAQRRLAEVEAECAKRAGASSL